jgi:hypothetical protein
MEHKEFRNYDSKFNIFMSAGVFGFSPFYPSQKMDFSLFCVLNDFGRLLDFLHLFAHLLLTPSGRAVLQEVAENKVGIFVHPAARL